jgi:hypothetical protein
MRWGFLIQQKLKIAGMLAFLLGLVVLTNCLERKNVGDMNKSFASIYNDRLIPATEIIYLTENLYSKRLLMQRFLLLGKDEQKKEVQKELLLHSKLVDSLIFEFEKTYLVVEEFEVLAQFKQKAQEYAAVEKEILSLSGEGAKEGGLEIFEGKGKLVFKVTMEHLHQLTKIQSDEGQELIKDSRVIVASTNIISSLQIGLAVIIGIVVQVLILTSRMVKFKPGKFNLN